jgi:8-oxo-dGTP diphosphatase
VGRSRQLLYVVAGVLTAPDGRVLIAQRPPGKHLAGGWEFPGGKRDECETPHAALRRELIEELGVTLSEARPLIRYRHDYDDRSVDLDVWLVPGWDGEPVGLEHQALDWVEPRRLMDHDLLLADRPISIALQLPSHYLITGEARSDGDFGRRLAGALDRGLRLVQLRMPGAPDVQVRSRASLAVDLCRARGARLLINGEPVWASTIASEVGAAGIHVPSRYLGGLKSVRPTDDLLCGASCHDRRELETARAAGADFAVLGPLLPTRSHPESAGIGWEAFGGLIEGLPLPVFALGGLGREHTETAWRAGGQGVAGISAFWSG